MELTCDCGTIIEVSITEGRNPGCSERENIECPNCGKLLHSGVYNDASVGMKIVYDPNDGNSPFFNLGETPIQL